MKNLLKAVFLIPVIFLNSTLQICAQAPVNDECSGAVSLTVGSSCTYTQFTNLNATASTSVPNPSCGQYMGGDVWFKFVAPAAGVVEINSNVGNITDGVMSVYSGTCGGTLTELECDDDDSPNGLMCYIIRTGLTAGNTYYIRFWSYNNAESGTFSLCVNIPGSNVPGQCTNSNPAGCACPTPGATDCYLLPDITAGRRTLNETRGWEEHGQLVTGPNKGLVRIDVSTPNIGWGPMEVTPTNDYICGGDTLRDFFPSSSFMCPDGSFPKRLINQRIYRKVGNSFQYLLRPAGFMVYHPSHGHIHLDGWGLYTLRLKDPSVTDTLSWPIVNSGIKVSFCLIDLSTCTGALGDCLSANGTILTNDSIRNYGLGGGYNCGNQLQGISTGKVDIYGRYLDESFVRVPYEACNGTYYVVVQIDPDNHFQEINENNNWLAAKTALTQQRTSSTGPYSYIFSKKGNVLCPGDSLLLSANGASNYVWSTGATTQSILIRQPGRYWVKSTTPCGVATSDTLDVFTSGASSFPADVRQDTVCSGGSAQLYASGNAHWFDAPTGGNLLHVGNQFQTGTLSQSTTFYVADQPPLQSDSVGLLNSSVTGQGNYSVSRDEYLIFNAFLPFKLKRVTVNAATTGVRYIQLRTMYGDVIAEKQVIVRAGVQDVDLDFQVPSGLNLQLGVSPAQAAPGLYSSTTNQATIGYPFKLSSLMNIVGSSLGDQTYPFFYNWQVEAVPQTCNDGARMAVTAVVAPDVTPSINGVDPLYLHTDNPVLVVLNPPGGQLSGPGVLGNTFDPRAAGVGVHTLQYVYSFGGCERQASVQTEVAFDSSVIIYATQIQMLGVPGPKPRLRVVSNTASVVDVTLRSSVGQLMMKNRYGAQRGNNLFEIDMERFSKGVYILDVYYESEKRRDVFKIVR